jgi:2'-hydroxyisoflavone reductase
VRRASRGGPIAVPGSLAQPVQIVDSRDLAAYVVRLLAEDRPGAFTAVGPPTTLGGLVAACAAAAGTRVTPVPVPLALAPRSFPLVKPVESWPTQRRVAAPGFQARPLAETVADVLAWDRERGGPPPARGFTAADEARVLGSAR